MDPLVLEVQVVLVVQVVQVGLVVLVGLGLLHCRLVRCLRVNLGVRYLLVDQLRRER